MNWIAILLLVIVCPAAARPTELVHEAALGSLGWMQGAVKQDIAALNRFMADDLR